MNRNPDGTEFTLEQLKALAVESGMTPAKVKKVVESFQDPKKAHSKLLTLTASHRMERMGTGPGMLRLDTRNRFNSPELFGGKAH